MDYFAGALLGNTIQQDRLSRESRRGRQRPSTERTIVTAVESRAAGRRHAYLCRGAQPFRFGMAALSAGTPMFLMGEEIGAAKSVYHYNIFLEQRGSHRRADGQTGDSCSASIRT